MGFELGSVQDKVCDIGWSVIGNHIRWLALSNHHKERNHGFAKCGNRNRTALSETD